MKPSKVFPARCGMCGDLLWPHANSIIGSRYTEEGLPVLIIVCEDCDDIGE